VSVRVDIAGAVLQWAVERSGRTRHDLRAKFPRFDQWIAGEQQPTFKQAENFARYTYTPLGMLFLPEPPEERMPVPDFRTRGRRQAFGRPSPNLLDTIYTCEARQEWYRAYAVRNDFEPLDFVGSLDVGSPPDTAAEALRRRLDFSLEARQEFRTWTEALREMIDRTEDIGVLVMINGVVGNNTHRPLDPDEFGGFALVDSYAPLVFVNGADTKAAQIFTLAHELAHIWVGQSAVSNSAVAVIGVDEAAEGWCNEVAAELLVPAASLAERFVRNAEIHDELQRLARFYKVSTLVVLRRLFDGGLVRGDAYQEAYEGELERIRDHESTSSGGNFYATQPLRSSHRFTKALIGDTLSGRTLYREAFGLLGVKNPQTFEELGERLGVG
jgi:Zn-dependent peptidase ImmA (M78 family)